jgi:hypothetical protein
MSFSSDEVNFLVYRYLQVMENTFFTFVTFVYLCYIALCLYWYHIDCLLARTLIVSAHFSVRAYLLAYYL